MPTPERMRPLAGVRGMAREAPDRGWGAWGRVVRPAVVTRKAWRGAALIRGGEEDQAMLLIGITQKIIFYGKEVYEYFLAH
jgi:hypothetical protein